MTELKVQVPTWVKQGEAENEFLRSLMTKALLKMEFYRSKMRPFESRYESFFTEFKEKVESSSEENLEAWDDLLAWEAYHIAFVEWEERYEELVQCLGK